MALDKIVTLGGFVRAKGRAKGLSFVATDLDWSWGSGPTVTGPAEDLLLALFIGPDGFNPNAECENFIENNKPDFQGLGAGSSYTFQIPNAPGAYTLMMQNNCDTTPPQSIGSVDFEIN